MKCQISRATEEKRTNPYTYIIPIPISYIDAVSVKLFTFFNFEIEASKTIRPVWDLYELQWRMNKVMLKQEVWTINELTTKTFKNT